MSTIKSILITLITLFGFQSFAQVAVIASVSAFEKNNKAYLQWATSKEYKNFGFEIERSTDSQAWEVIGFINGQTKSLDYVDYQYIDQNPINGTNFYRLKLINHDGSFIHSSHVKVQSKFPAKNMDYPVIAMIESEK